MERRWSDVSLSQAARGELNGYDLHRGGSARLSSPTGQRQWKGCPARGGPSYVRGSTGGRAAPLVHARCQGWDAEKPSQPQWDARGDEGVRSCNRAGCPPSSPGPRRETARSVPHSSRSLAFPPRNRGSQPVPPGGGRHGLASGWDNAGPHAGSCRRALTRSFRNAPGIRSATRLTGGVRSHNAARVCRTRRMPALSRELERGPRSARHLPPSVQRYQTRSQPAKYGENEHQEPAFPHIRRYAGLVGSVGRQYISVDMMAVEKALLVLVGGFDRRNRRVLAPARIVSR